MNNIKVSPELLVLINASLRRDSDLPLVSDKKELNWELIIKLARWHQIRPLLFDYLEKNKNLEVPEKYTRILKECTVSQAVTNMSFLKSSLDLYEQLHDSHIRSFLMKGALWAWMLYEKPGSREFGDVDYFIEKESIKESLGILARNGFEPDAYRTYLMEKKKVADLYLKTDYQLPLQPVRDHALQSLEIQWNSSYPRYCYTFTWQELTSGMIDFPLLKSSIKIPCIENQLLMMIIHHGGIEQWDKLKYAADFERILRKHAVTMDWDYIITVTKSKGFYYLMMESLGLITKLTGENYLKYSPADDSRIYPDNKFLDDIIRHWENERPVRKSKSWRIFKYNIKYRDRWEDKINIIFAHLSYLTQWQLIWHKLVWYNRRRY